MKIKDKKNLHYKHFHLLDKKDSTKIDVKKEVEDFLNELQDSFMKNESNIKKEDLLELFIFWKDYYEKKFEKKFEMNFQNFKLCKENDCAYRKENELLNKRIKENSYSVSTSTNKSLQKISTVTRPFSTFDIKELQSKPKKKVILDILSPEYS